MGTQTTARAGDTPPAATAEPGNWVVEAWRGVAAWMVVYAHYWAFSGTDWAVLRLTHTGVDLFFVVSGFVFAPYLSGQTLQVGPFAVRRFFRIYPAYVLALAVYIAMKAHSGQQLHHVWEHLTFMHVQSREMAFYYNPPFWSLPAEVEFYLALALGAPAIAWAHRQFGRGVAMKALLMIGLAAAALRSALGMASDPASQNLAFIALHHLPGVLVEFLLGVAAWHVSARLLSIGLRAGLFAAGLGCWWMLADWFGQVGDEGLHASWARGQMGMLTAACFALMVAATAGRRTAPPEKASPGIQLALWAGRLSYGVYLFHIAALRLAEKAAEGLGWGWGATRWAAVALTVITAWIVYRWWENPWRLWGREWARPPLRTP